MRSDSKVSLEKKAVRFGWISLVIGILSIVVGVGCLVWPGSSLAAFTLLFVLALLVSGVLNILFAVLNRNRISYWSWTLVRGIVELLLGIWLIVLPLPVVSAGIVYLIGFYMLFHSIVGIGESCELQRCGMEGWGWLLACHIASLLFSFVYLMSPLFGGLFVVFFLGFSLICYGVFRIVFAIELRRFNRKVRKLMEDEKHADSDDDGIEDAIIIE